MKDKYLQIFEYLLEFSKLRSKPVRDIESSVEYPENVWLADIPQCDIFDGITFPKYNQDADYWIKIGKPKEPKQPNFPALSESFIDWIIKDSLTDESGIPCLNESIIKNGKTIQLIEYPEVQIIFQEYLNNQWLDDLELYKKEVNDFQIKHDEFEVQSKIYKRFFSIYNKVEQFGEEYELVFGAGLLYFKENQNTPRICRHILTSKADITFDHSKKESFIKVSSSIGSKIQIETDSILGLNNQFNDANIIAAENKVKYFLNREDISDNIFLAQVKESIQLFIDTIHAEGDWSSIDDLLMPQVPSNKPTVYFAPALLLRKRNTKSLAAVYEEIINNVKNAGEALDIPSINGIIDSNYINGSTSEGSSLLDDDNTIYFPKKYNDEQIQIIEKIRRSNKVLVQGPPGTGKSHTIANLICHLLANGQKVLVTAYTKRALEVLKKQLPEDFQNLTVNLLSGDSTSMQDLNHSVNSINDKLASFTDINGYKEDIEKQKLKLSKTKEAKAYTINEWSKVKEQSTTNQRINPNYEGTLLEIAEILENESSTFSWFKDDYSDIESIDGIALRVEEFCMLVKDYQSIDPITFDYLIPNIEQLLTLTELINYQNILTAIVKYKPLQENYNSIITEDFKVLKKKLENILSVSLRIEQYCLSFKENIIDVNNIILWSEKILTFGASFKS